MQISFTVEIRQHYERQETLQNVAKLNNTITKLKLKLSNTRTKTKTTTK